MCARACVRACACASLYVYVSERTYAYSYSKRERERGGGGEREGGRERERETETETERYLHEFEYSREMLRLRYTRLRYGDGLRIATSNNPFVTLPSAKGITLLLRHRCGWSFSNQSHTITPDSVRFGWSF